MEGRKRRRRRRKKRSIAKVSRVLSIYAREKYNVSVFFLVTHCRPSNSQRGQKSRIVDFGPRHPFIPASREFVSGIPISTHYHILSIEENKRAEYISSKFDVNDIIPPDNDRSIIKSIRFNSNRNL